MAKQNNSSQGLRILSVEDSQQDFELIRELILEAGYQAEMERVETEEDFVKALQEKAYDIILADFKLPTFDAFRALENSKKIRPDIPFIVMSGSIGEETAIELIKLGSVDYVLKDRPQRLAAAIQRAIEEAHQKQAHQRAEEALAKNDQLLRLAGEIAMFGGWQLDLVTNRFEWSDIVCEIHEVPLGYSPSIEEALQFITPEWRDKTNEAFTKCAQEGLAFNEEVEIINRTGKRIWVRTIGEAARDQHGQIIAVQGAIQDISQRKKSVKALQESEKRFRSLVDNLPGVVYLCKNDARYTMTYLPDEVEDLTGYPAEEFINDRISFVDLYHPDDLPVIYQRVGEGVENHEPFHLIYRLQHRNGEWRWMEEWGTGVFEEEELAFLEGFIIDITERKAIETALAESERIFQIALKNSPVTVFKMDTNLRYTWIHNPAPGILPQDVIGKTHAERFPPEDAEKLTAIKQQVLDAGEGLRQIIHTSGQGLPEYQDLTIEPTKDTDGNITGIICSSVDITKFKKAEEAQRQRLTELETIRRISETFQITNSIDEALAILLRETLSALNFPAGSIRLYNPEKNDLRVRVAEGWFKAIDGEAAKPGQGIAGKVFSSGKKHISKEFVTDFQVNPDTKESIPEGWGGVGVPIHAFDEIIGVFFVSCQLPQEMQPDQIQFLESLAQIAGISLHRMTLLEEALQRLTELETIRRISETFQITNSIDEALAILLKETLSALNLSAGCISLYNPQQNELKMKVAKGWFKAIEGEAIKPTQGITGHIFASGKAHIAKEFISDPIVNANVRGSIPEGWGGVGVPIHAFDEIIGVFFVSCQLPQEMQPHQIQFLESLAQIAGISLHRMTLLEEALQRLEKLKSQHAIDQAVASMSDLALTLEIISRQALNRLPADAVGILLYHPHDQTLTYASGTGFKFDAYKQTKIKLTESHIAGRAALEHKTIHLEDIRTNPNTSDDLKIISAEGFSCYTAIPLIAKGKIKGVLEVFHVGHFHHSTEWQNDMATLATQTAVAIDTLQMYDHLHQKNLELTNAYDATIEGWSLALEYRDEETEGHTLRVTEISLKLARSLGVKEAELINIRYGALLHDIGKIGIPDSILLKPGPLTDEEWEIMKQHPRMAYNMLAPIEYLRSALDIPYYHHEKWDGSGYPSGLKGNQIPIGARIFAIVDVWDALRSDRPYRKAWPEKKTLEYIREQSGVHFDPDVVDAFFNIFPV
jgi:PAS domain S-box-containing protein